MARIKRNAGFTLIELLVVVIIIGMILGLAQLNFNRNLDNVARNEARRYARVLNYIKEYSAYTGRVLSLRLDKTSNTYYFLYIDPVGRNWNRLTDRSGNKLLAPHVINKRVQVSLISGSEDVADDAGPDSGANIQVALVTPFSEFETADLVLHGETREYIVTTDEFNDIAIRIK